MQNSLYMQNNFTHGELDPRLFAGTNLEYYYKSLSKCRNLYVRPQGGIKRRHGTYYEATINSNPGEYQIASFVYNDDNHFIVIFQPSELFIYKVNDDGTLGTSYIINTPDTADFTASNCPEIKFAQNGNLLVIVHSDFAPKELVYDPITPTFTISTLPIKNPPCYDYNKDYYNYDFNLSTVAAGKTATLTSSTAIFTDDYINGIFISIGGSTTEPIGLARIKSVGSATPLTTCTVDVIYKFDSSVGTNVLGENCFLAEPAISSNRGYPHAVTFYEDRLIFGATDQLPQTLFMSKIGEFNDFNQGDSSDDDAIIFTLSDSEYNRIKYIISDTSLQIFCSDAEFSSMQYFAEPLTPHTVSFRKQSSYGVSDVKPRVIDNKTLYVRQGGNAVMSFQFGSETNSYLSQNASIFSSHLIRNPVSTAVLKGDGLEDADYMFFVNEDGSLTVLQTVDTENVSAYSICLTGTDHSDLSVIEPNQGKFKQIIAVKNTIFCSIERVINGSRVEYLERFSFDYYTDSSINHVYGAPTKVITGLGHLDGTKPDVIGDGKILNIDNSVNDGKVTGGSLTLLEEATNITVGLPVDVLAETIPANVVGSHKLYLPKRITRLFVDYYESIGIQVNGRYIPELEFGPNTLDSIPKAKTGIYTSYGDKWGQRVSMQIKQTDPLPFLVIGLGYEVTE